jgi:hypothetical protein
VLPPPGETCGQHEAAGIGNQPASETNEKAQSKMNPSSHSNLCTNEAAVIRTLTVTGQKTELALEVK